MKYAEVVIFDHDGDDGPGMCSSDSQSLSGDHYDTVFGDSPLHTLGSGWRRWGQCRRRRPGASYQTNVLTENGFGSVFSSMLPAVAWMRPMSNRSVTLVPAMPTPSASS